MNHASASSAHDRQGDLMLWIAGGAVAALGLIWLLLSHPWSSAAAPAAVPAAVQPEAPATAPSTAAGRGTSDEALDNPLRMAELALEAGMLVEPEDYSAWSLFKQVLDADPDNAAAKDGLNRVAEQLLEQAGVALEQGRYDDARDTAQRILAVLPDDADAASLLAKVEANEPKPAPAAAQRPSPRSAPAPKPAPAKKAAPPPEPTVAEQPPAPRVDRVLETRNAFRSAMSENRLLTPAGDSAKHYVELLMKIAPDNDMTKSAQRVLFDELIARSRQALEALDTDAARTWIDEAEQLGGDPGAVTRARSALTDSLVARESQRPLPASALKVTHYEPPQYPSGAARRGIEGWVDVEFTVATDGTTRDISVSDASDKSYFRDESVEAVSQWRFEPRVYLGRTIAQRLFTRIRFTLDDSG